MKATPIAKRRFGRFAGAALSLLTAAAMLMPSSVSASIGPVLTYPQDTTLFISGPTLTLLITAGSGANNLTVTDTTFTVTVPSGSTFTARYPGPNPGRFPNDGSLAECHIVATNNDFVVTGPKTVTVTPNATHCSTGGGGAVSTPSINLFQPNGGAFTAGDATTVIWSIGGDSILSARLSLSTDGGATYPTQIGTGLPGNSFAWTVPNVSTTHGRIRVEGLSSSATVLATDVGDADFTIVGSTDATPTPPPPPHETMPPIHFHPSQATEDGGPTISDDKDLDMGQQGTADCPAHQLIKLPDDGNPDTQTDSTVYYCGRDGHRWIFPNAKVYFSWYQDFSNVLAIDAARMARIPLGGNVTYRPGLRMIKMPNDTHAYAVSKDGILHLIPDEATAAALYGPDWRMFVDDIDPAFFSDYVLGADVESASGTTP